MKDHSFVELSHYSNQICDVCNKGLPWMTLGSKPVQCKREGREGRGGVGKKREERGGEGKGGDGRGGLCCIVIPDKMK